MCRKKKIRERVIRKGSEGKQHCSVLRLTKNTHCILPISFFLSTSASGIKRSFSGEALLLDAGAGVKYSAAATMGALYFRPFTEAMHSLLLTGQIHTGIQLQAATESQWESTKQPPGADLSLPSPFCPVTHHRRGREEKLLLHGPRVPMRLYIMAVYHGGKILMKILVFFHAR